MIFNVTRIQKLSKLAIFLFLVFSHGAIAKDTNSERIESETKLQGWTHQGQCKNKDDSSIRYRLDYYSPPPRKDVGGYGILTIIKNSKEITFSGFDLYPQKRTEDCKTTVVGKNILIINGEDWSRSKRYIASINLISKTKDVFQYNLKKGKVYSKKVSNNILLIAGFGLCKKGYVENWRSDLFCENVGQNRFNLAKEYLESTTGLIVKPYIPSFGAGVFNYYILCENCEISESEEINCSLKEFLTASSRKIQSLKPNEGEFYDSLLAFSGIFVNAPQLEKDFPITHFLEVEDKKKRVESEFKAYWNIIFDKN